MKQTNLLRYYICSSLLSDIPELVLKNLVVSRFLAVTELIAIERSAN
jgi:hypothetical protein